MEILKDIVLPQSPTHILLLKYLLFLILVILLPYLSVMIGSTLFSVMHFNKGEKSNNRNYLIFAKELIDLFTMNKGMSFSLGIVPLISLAFALSQLLYGSGLTLAQDLLFAIIILFVALIYTYVYKYSFALKNVFNIVKISDEADEPSLNEFNGLRKSNSKLLAKSGTIGFILLVFVAFILVGVLQLSFDSSRWNENSNFIDLLFSVNTVLYLLFYLSFSFSITSAAIILKYFKSDSRKYDKEYLNFVKNFALKTGLIFSFLQPLLFVVTILSTPISSLSFLNFIVIPVILTIMLVISIIFYLMYKDSKMNLNGSLVFLFLILVSSIVYKDQLAFDTTSEKQIFNLSKEYELFALNVKEEAGIKEVVEYNGEDIFNGKCIACHKFDVKLVGPAYKDVLPKYEGKREELVDFILNPRKINPAFTPMPNQGLRRGEAEAIADYIVKVYSESM